MACQSSVCSHHPALAFVHRVGEHDDFLATSIVLRFSAFCKDFPRGGIEHPCPISYGLVSNLEPDPSLGGISLRHLQQKHISIWSLQLTGNVCAAVGK